MLDFSVFWVYNKDTEREREVNTMKYEVIVAGKVVATYDNADDAYARLRELRHSYLAIVHPFDAMYVRKVGDNND